MDKQAQDELITKISELAEAPVTYLDVDTKKVFHSERGFIGYASDIDDQNYIRDEGHVVDVDELNEFGVPIVAPRTKDNPTSKEIDGGNTGAFERRQLGYGGFDKITSNLTLPSISNITSGEQAWVYYGFDSSRGAGIEGGFAHQTGTFRWLPFIRVGGIYYQDDGNYSLTPYYDGNTINDFNFVIKKRTSGATYYTAYLYIGSGEIFSWTTNFTSSDINTMSVKRMTTIAKKDFDSTDPTKAIDTKSQNQRYASVNVRRYYNTFYESWDSYSEYKRWDGTKWYGTVDCTSSYVKRSGSYVSIYR
ncbi:MAG: hypothetical protein PHG06_17260 [Parabacteroides sp.]|nr:hypothetical protein [Parabacteroides sp.]